tara:strand:- start:3855 stop:5051 length:1197 start_codon:yes stop_codon:yes gene_type:complete
MNKNYLTLFIEISNSHVSFLVGEKNDYGNFKLKFKTDMPSNGIEDNKIFDLEKAFNLFKENIYLIEQKFQYTFREIILILDHFNPSFVSVSGFKKLNGSQVLKENITYILNSLKSYINEIESKKTILHIFNSKFSLDNKKVFNLPIGLFGDFYCHELSFTLIKTTDFKNLENIFSKCNLKIKKILLKSFVSGVNISENNKSLENFFNIKINDNFTKIFYFEDDSLKFEQEFKFGSDIIIRDISKITSIKKETVINILEKIEFSENMSDEDLVEKDFFKEDIYKKIKKKLVFEIAFARIKEISEILLFKNINFKHHNNFSRNIFLEIANLTKLKSLKKIYKLTFSTNKNIQVNFLNYLNSESLLKTADKLVHFGWNKEAIPISSPKKSIITRFFESIFG